MSVFLCVAILLSQSAPLTPDLWVIDLIKQGAGIAALVIITVLVLKPVIASLIQTVTNERTEMAKAVSEGMMKISVAVDRNTEAQNKSTESNIKLAHEIQRIIDRIDRADRITSHGA